MPPVPKRRGTPASATGAALYTYLPFDLDAALREHARDYDVPLSRVVQQAVRDHLDRLDSPPQCGCIPHRPVSGSARE